jgi:copper chaperone CopZ
MKTLKIEGMSCGHCERRVKNALEEIDGVTVISVSGRCVTSRSRGRSRIYVG